ncbi:TonB-dependent receptor [Dysgonomonas capnocytophagoides]|uniref:TonB-dependent receptor n=1 Tax=Dysgonomonas capnocytophagoides TaxID=45254 RepID=UPI0033414E36
MKNFRFFLILISLITCTSAYSQNTGSFVSGTVVTPDKEPLENVSVAIEGTSNGALTDKDGKFRFSAPVGEHTLVVSSIEHKPYKKVVTLKRGENSFNVTLSTSDNELREVVVLNSAAKFSNKESEYIARLPIKYLENPQVYSVIGKELMKEQVIVNFDDALKNAPGIDKLWSSTGRGGDGAAYFSLRGFATQANMVNGLGGQTNGGLDPANIERIEVLKGPSGTLFGSSLISLGGLINIVTKKPYEHFGGELSYTVGSYGLNRVSADVNTPLDKDNKVLLRTNAAYQYENSFQDAGFKKTFFVAPSLTYNVNNRLSFNLNAEFYSSEGTNPLMVFLNRGRQLEARTPKELGMDYKRSFTSNDITVKTPTVKLYGTMDYKISDQWTSQTAVSSSNRKSEGLYSYVMFQGAVKDDILSRWVGAQNATTNTFDIQQNFIGDFKIGNLRNRLVVGVDYFSSNDNSSSNYIKFDEVSSKGDSHYGDLSKAAVDTLLARSTPYASITNTRVYSAYFSDVLNVTDRLLLMASLRLDYFDNRGTLDVVSRENTGKYNQTALSPKFGAIYQILPDKLSVFANYMNGFQNVSPGIQPDGTVRSFKPQQANQIEGGFKATLFDGKLVGNISYYDIYVNNVTRNDPNATEPGYTIQDGDVYSRGVDFDITASPFSGLTIIAGYSYNKSQNKKTDPSTNGRRPLDAGPENLINGWISYTIQDGAAKGLGFGFGGNYASKNNITNSAETGKFTIPAYTILNATAFYNTGAFRFALKVDNIANKEYWKGWSTVEPQKLRQVIGNITFNF